MDALCKPEILGPLLACLDVGVLVFADGGGLSFVNEIAAAFFSSTPADLLQSPPSLPNLPADVQLPGGRIRIERLPGVATQVLVLRRSRGAPPKSEIAASKVEVSRAPLLDAAQLHTLLGNELLAAQRCGAPLIVVRVHGATSRSERVADCLRHSLRRTDSVARVMDELWVLLPRTRFAEGALVCRKLRAALQRLARHEKLGLRLELEALPLDAVTPEEALRLAEPGRERRGGLLLGSSSSAEVLPAHAAATIASLQRGESLPVVALPVVQLGDMAAIGWELFARGPGKSSAEHREQPPSTAAAGPFRGPEQLLQLAMEAGIATHADLTCLKSCLRASACLPSDARLHVNLLPGTLLDPDRPRLVDLLEKSARPVCCVELAERLLVGDPSQLLPAIAQLRALGLRVALDGVGFGRSVLEALIVLEPEIVKIHRQFIHGIARDPARQRPVRRMLKLLDSVGSQCVATGIENEQDLQMVRELGIPFAQGFLWGMPRPLSLAAQGAAR